MQSLLSITRAIDNESRLRILLSLRDGELCLCQIVDFLELAPSTVSRHVDLLRQSGLIEMRKEGRWHFYRLVGRSASPVVRDAIRWVLRSLQEDPAVQADETRIRKLREIAPEELTACYARD